jgi:nucleoside-diphosphate-sugar epimerase
LLRDDEECVHVDALPECSGAAQLTTVEDRVGIRAASAIACVNQTFAPMVVSGRLINNGALAMRVFVTGASGHIASAVIPELLGAGHQVVGLARSDQGAITVENAGAEVVRGDLSDPARLGEFAAGSDGVIHLAFDNSFTDVIAAAASDLAAIEAIGGALEGTHKPFVVTTGTLMLAIANPGKLGTEDEALPGGPRIDSENAAIALASKGVRSSAVRLAPLVHSDLDLHGFAHWIIVAARRHGVSAYVGDGANRWPALNTRDAASLYRLALERAPAGSRLHGVESNGVQFREIAEVVGRHLGFPAQSISAEEAEGHFGFPLSWLVGLDNPISNAITCDVLGWSPNHVGIIEDLELGHYFDLPAA